MQALSPEKELHFASYKIQLTQKPRVMGILNVTPDSFSDGDLYFDPARAEAHALKLEAEGAAILDVGGESSRPGASAISAKEELGRLIPVLKRIIPKLKIPVSVDTCKYDVMHAVLDLGVSVINDICAMSQDERIPALIQRYHAGIVLMHMRGTPSTMQAHCTYDHLEREITEYLRVACHRALDKGVAPEQILVDPGIGFGKSAQDNCRLIQMVPTLKAELGLPVLLGLSRKSFLKKIAGGQNTSLELSSAVAHAIAVSRGADILRVHDVKETLAVVELTRSLFMADKT